MTASNKNYRDSKIKKINNSSIITITKKETNQNGMEEEKLTECLVINSGMKKMKTPDHQEVATRVESTAKAKEKDHTMDTKVSMEMVNLMMNKMMIKNI